MAVDMDAISASLRRAIAAELEEQEDLVVLSSQSRRRSDLWFMGLPGERGPKWVVKRPRTDSRQGDLRPPLSSQQQFAALVRLSEHVLATGSALRTPAPVALLPDIDAFAMRFVQGRHVAGLIRATAVRAPGPLLAGVAAAADALRVVHALPPPQKELSTPEGPLEASSDRLDRAATPSLAPRAQPSAEIPSPLPGRRTRTVVIHGDFAPENIMLAGPTVYCLEPGLTDCGPPEIDVVRFLTMLYDAPMFILCAWNPAVQRLRRRAAATFLAAYLGDEPVSPMLQQSLRESLASRWATRHDDVVERDPSLRGARIWLLRKYFSALLQEKSFGDIRVP
jgi:aminoglycoside phosphotransferase (APT) family kinase protein